jgi:hypothetical protein
MSDALKSLAIMARVSTSDLWDMKQPSSVKFRTWLELHTHDGYDLVHGVKGKGGKPDTPGLFDFSRILSTIYRRAKLDDPYADWWLIKIESRANLVKDFLKIMIENIDPRVGTPHIAQPKRVETYFGFGNPYSHKMALLITYYDHFLRLAYVAKSLGNTDRRQFNYIRYHVLRRVRSVLVLPLGYRRYIRLSRHNLTSDDPEVQAAIANIPGEVSSGKKRPKSRPWIPEHCYVKSRRKLANSEMENDNNLNIPRTESSD